MLVSTYVNVHARSRVTLCERILRPFSLHPDKPTKRRTPTPQVLHLFFHSRMKTVAVYTASACCGAAVMGSTAFLSSPPTEGGRPLWRSSQSRLRASPSRARSTRGSVGSRNTGCGVAGVAFFAPLHELPRGGRSTAAAGSHQMTLLSNLDLKPAYRLFDTVPPPTSMEGMHQTCDVDLDVDGNAPYGKRLPSLGRRG